MSKPTAGETEALLPGLEQVPKRSIEYRGLVVEEMDVDAVVARQPQVAIVDELAHTNPPGCRNGKRYQDVYDLLNAGINVICAFNVQHLESLKDVVQRVTGVVIRETVPDTFVKQADQVINVDLAIEDLVDRLRGGKIYGEDKISWALEHFFKDNNLLTLRELALREVAESVDRVAVAAQQPNDKPRKRASSRVMVCMASSSPNASALLRRGFSSGGSAEHRLVCGLCRDPAGGPAPDRLRSPAALIANIEKARELGAEAMRVRGKDPVSTLIDFARSHGVAYVMIGRSRSGGLPSWLRRTRMYDFVAEAEGLDLHIVSFDEEGEE